MPPLHLLQRASNPLRRNTQFLRSYASSSLISSAVRSQVLATSAEANLEAGLAGSVPFHNAYVFLHHPLPASTYPSKLDSKLLRTLTLLGGKLNIRIPVNFCWMPDSDYVPGSVGAPTSGYIPDAEHYPATIFLAQEFWQHDNAHSQCPQAIRIPRVDESNVDAIADILSGSLAQADLIKQYTSPELENQQHIFICTHGARDCRCGETGGAVFRALQTELSTRRALPKIAARHVVDSKDDYSVWDVIKIGEVSHIGGHKHAGNALLYPSGTWLGNIQPEDAPALLDVVASSIQPVPHDPEINDILHAPSDTNMKFLVRHWRGQMGLKKEIHRDLVEKLAQL